MLPVRKDGDLGRVDLFQTKCVSRGSGEGKGSGSGTDLAGSRVNAGEVDGGEEGDDRRGIGVGRVADDGEGVDSVLVDGLCGGWSEGQRGLGRRKVGLDRVGGAGWA